MYALLCCSGNEDVLDSTKDERLKKPALILECFNKLNTVWIFLQDYSYSSNSHFTTYLILGTSKIEKKNLFSDEEYFLFSL